MSTSKKIKSDNLHKNHIVQLVSSVLLMVVGAGLLITGFFIPPQGEIHGSVLMAFGEILTFVGAIFGIDYRYKAKILIRQEK